MGKTDKPEGDGFLDFENTPEAEAARAQLNLKVVALRHGREIRDGASQVQRLIDSGEQAAVMMEKLWHFLIEYIEYPMAGKIIGKMCTSKEVVLDSKEKGAAHFILASWLWYKTRGGKEGLLQYIDTIYSHAKGEGEIMDLIAKMDIESSRSRLADKIKIRPVGGSDKDAKKDTFLEGAPKTQTSFRLGILPNRSCEVESDQHLKINIVGEGATITVRDSAAVTIGEIHERAVIDLTGDHSYAVVGKACSGFSNDIKDRIVILCKRRDQVKLDNIDPAKIRFEIEGQEDLSGMLM
ncbi:hypothetical protein KKA95_04510 [Patescibacteria group bacterium]|nr:hypothetical protein [Patescibacteria group bacterium]